MNGRVSRLLEFLGTEESGVFCETSWIAPSRLINLPNLYDTNTLPTSRVHPIDSRIRDTS